MLYIHKTITYVILNYDIIYFVISVTFMYVKSAFESFHLHGILFCVLDITCHSYK